jgi:predicted DNA-binding transcriptional regulator YafY
MSRPTGSRRRPVTHITLARASRLHRLVRLLGESPRSREDLLGELGIGLRTFYRELVLLKSCGIKVELKGKAYVLRSTAEEALGGLPFPDPQLSFSEMSELARGTGPAAQRLAELLGSVIHPTAESIRRRRKK